MGNDENSIGDFNTLNEYNENSIGDFNTLNENNENSIGDFNTLNGDASFPHNAESELVDSRGNVDRYSIIEKSSEGFFHAFDNVAKVDVFIKVLPGEISGNPVEMEAIREKFSSISALHHPHICTMLFLHQIEQLDNNASKLLKVAPGNFLIIMEYAKGTTLSEWVKSFPNKKVPLDLVLDICIQIADALDYSHKQNVVHHDIRPDNILIDTSSDFVSVSVLDFGLSCEIDKRVNGGEEDSTLRSYMSPEKLTGKKNDNKTDQYSLAVLLYELICSHVPFESSFASNDIYLILNLIENKLPDPIQELSTKQNKALLKALSKKPSDRFKSCRDFIEALQKVSRRPNKKLKKLVRNVITSAILIFIISYGLFYYNYMKNEKLRRIKKDSTTGRVSSSQKVLPENLKVSLNNEEEVKKYIADMKKSLLQADALIADNKWQGARDILLAYALTNDKTNEKKPVKEPAPVKKVELSDEEKKQLDRLVKSKARIYEAEQLLKNKMYKQAKGRLQYYTISANIFKDETEEFRKKIDNILKIAEEKIKEENTNAYERDKIRRNISSLKNSFDSINYYIKEKEWFDALKNIEALKITSEHYGDEADNLSAELNEYRKSISKYVDPPAGVKKLILPENYHNVVLNKVTGDLAAITFNTSEITVFKKGDLDKGIIKANKTEVAGERIDWLIYKEFMGKSYYLALVKKQNKIYYIDSTTMEILGIIRINGYGLAQIYTSKNPEDPYVYYCSQDKLKVGVVNIRELKDFGLIGIKAEHINTISSKGDYLYCYLDIKTHCYKRINSFIDDKPSFTKISTGDGHTVNPIPVSCEDRVTKFAAWGENLFNRELTTKLNIKFFTNTYSLKRPYMYSFANEYKKGIVISALSYNTFQKNGRDVLIPLYYSMSYARKEETLLLNDESDELYLKLKNYLFIVPIATFKHKKQIEEVKLVGAESVYANRQANFRLKLPDDDIKVTYDEFPNGVVVNDDMSLTWTPTLSDIGSHRIVALLEYNGNVKSHEFILQVNHEGMAIPFKADSIELSENGDSAVVWKRIYKTKETTIATIDIKNKSVTAVKNFGVEIQDLAIGNEYVVLSNPGKRYCDVLAVKNLDFVKRLDFTSNVLYLEIYKNILAVRCGQSIHLYNLHSFELLKTFVDEGRYNDMDDNYRKRILLPGYGVLVGNTLYDANFRPKLLLKTTIYPYAKTIWNPEQFLGINDSKNTGIPFPLPDLPGENMSLKISTEKQSNKLNKMNVDLHNSLNPAYVEKIFSGYGDEYTKIKLAASTGCICVMVGNRIYITPMKEYLPKLNYKPGIRWDAKQTTFCIGRDNEVTRLSHKVNKKGVIFELQSKYPGMSLDRNTGALTINNHTMMANCLKYAGSVISKRYYQNSIKHIDKTFYYMNGKRLNGVPVAVPVRISVTGDNNDLCNIEYTLLMDVDSKYFFAK